MTGLCGTGWGFAAWIACAAVSFLLGLYEGRRSRGS